ncbi:uncharacterized protein LOC127423605 [Myxocyprinus asiaticus]|uniref:uncharacterized protein LOC127423605 n=1 Tax=Myxocyprinus asiaticus TaxID=70543 RepID=UPI00222153B5|nr:uncharacterized protein LOC127423605 [Myxocyprinus asiaticus]
MKLSEDSFENYFDSDFGKKFILKDGAVPTILDTTVMLALFDLVITKMLQVTHHLLMFTIIPVLSLTPEIFYPFGSTAGDAQVNVNGDVGSSLVSLSSPFMFFGRSLNQIYVNNNGLLTFQSALVEGNPSSFPANSNEDFIAPLWTDLDDYGIGVFSYQQYTNGNVLTRASQDIHQHFPDLSLSATLVFVATWDFATGPGYLFQVVLISGSKFSFILMNYGDCAVPSQPVQAGYDTVKSTHFFVIPGSNNTSYIPQLKNTSNVNVPGRWAFRVDGLDIFYPFGSTAGDTEVYVNGDEASQSVVLSSPFMFFGQTFSQIFVNNNGLLTFMNSLPEANPYTFPASRSEAFIAPLWTDLDDYGLGVFSYNQYTNGSVLTRATQDVNQYFPDLSFTASWVFVATWDFVETWNRTIYNYHLNPSFQGYLFQVVLMSGSDFSFILMNYGDCAVPSQPVQAGYDTVNSTHYFVIPGSNNASYIPQLKNTSNVNVPGRWAFRLDGIQKYNIIGLQVGLTSLISLTENESIQIVLDKLKQELIKHGLPNSTEVNLRSLQKTKP